MAPEYRHLHYGYLTRPTIGECRFYARECTRWAEACGDKLTRKILLEVADIWAKRALAEQATNHPCATELKSQLSVGLRCSSGRLYMQGKRPDLERLPNLPKPPVLARCSGKSTRDYTRGQNPLLDDAAQRSSEPAIAWGLAVSAIVIAVVMIGWGWGVGNGGGWGHSNQLAQMIAPASLPTDGPATRAWTPPSNGQFR